MLCDGTKPFVPNNISLASANVQDMLSISLKIGASAVTSELLSVFGYRNIIKRFERTAIVMMWVLVLSYCDETVGRRQGIRKEENEVSEDEW